MGVIVQAVLIGTLLLYVGTIPRNMLFGANLAHGQSVPWAVPIIAAYIWLFWRYLNGFGPPTETSATRRRLLRANPLSGTVWGWSLVAGSLGIVALVIGLRVANRMVILPEQSLPALDGVPPLTMLALLLVSAPVAGVIEESSFRGYMQGPIEEKYGAVIAILVTGTMFGVVHLDFTLVLWPYYVAVAALYGMVTRITGSILPAIVLHTAGNTYSNLDLWLHGQAEWQRGAGSTSLIWNGGADRSFWLTAAFFAASGALTVAAFRILARRAAVAPTAPAVT